MRKLTNLKAFIFFIAFFISQTGDAQSTSSSPSIPAASIDKQSLEISNDLFNGKVNVSVPIYQYNFEGLNFPITLNYASGNGIRPDELPSWVGSGWNLQGSGFVHRTVRGKPDEALDIKTTTYDYPTGSGFPPDKIKTELNGDYSYFSNLNKLNVSNWYSGAYASTLSPGVTNFNSSYFNNSSGTVITTFNANPVYDLSPDEFSFSFGNISGKFYLNHLNKWIVITNDGKKYSVSVSTGELEVANFIRVVSGTSFKINYKTPRVIKNIIMTSEDGVRYYFGSLDVNLPLKEQLFDFSHASLTLSPFVSAASPPYVPYVPWVNGFDGPTYTEVVPHTWHLTKIENLKTGSEINFSYKQEGLQVSLTSQAWGEGGSAVIGGEVVFDNTIVFGDPNSEQSTFGILSPYSKIVTPNWTLTGINFPDNTTIDFNSKKSVQQLTNIHVDQTYSCGFGSYPDLINLYPLSDYCALLQLDKISISSNANVVKQFEFGYSLSPSQRLQLVSLQENDNNVVINKNQFYYENSIALPEYGSRKKDHWGFYNNNDFVSNYAPPYKDYTKLSNYYNSRNPNNNFSKSEILNKIVYSTKGEIRFQYEPHDYSKRKNPIDFAIINMGANPEAGGVRIKKVSYYSETNHLEYEKEYEYKIPGTSNSSGILSQPPPSYLTGTSASFDFKADGFFPVYSEGSHVTYSYATEKQTGKGASEYQFSNYDNGYNDVPAIEDNLSGSSSSYLPYAYSNKAFKRGHLLNLKVRNESGTPVQETQIKFLDTEDESNKDELRHLHLGTYTSTASPQYASVSNKIYNDIVIENKKIDYTSGGNMTMKKNDVYDLFGNLKVSSITDSKGNIIRSRYKYAYEYPATGTDPVSLGINNLIQKHCSNFLIEEIQTKEDAGGSNVYLLSGTIYTYKTQSPFVDKIFKLQPASVVTYSSFINSTISSGNFIKDVNYSIQPEVTYDLYDTKGNVLQQTSKAGIVESKIWGYSNTYPVASVVGADYNTAFSFVSAGNSTIQSPVNDQELSDLLNNIRLGLSGASALVSTFTYAPLIGITRKTDPNNFTTFYEYDALGRLTIEKDKDNNIIKTYEYHLKN